MKSHIFGKVFMERATAALYESLQVDDYGGVPWSQVPAEEKQKWIHRVAKWVMNFSEASIDMVSLDITQEIATVVEKQEFPIDTITQLKVVRSEVILDALDKLRSRKI